MTEIVNETPFRVQHAALFDRDGAESALVVVKATYDLGTGRVPEVADEQREIRTADVYEGDPEQTGLLADAELLPSPPTTGLTIAGRALAPRKGTTTMKVSVEIADLALEAIVFGKRHWRSLLGIARASSPEPFDAVDLTWSNAFGGRDLSAPKDKHHESCDENPAGVGFFARKSRESVEGKRLPQVEDPKRLVRMPRDRPRPVGFRPVAPVWMPRRQWAGTYDEAWQASRAPLLPDDFDPRFLQAAPRGLVSERRLAAGDACRIVGMTRDAPLVFEIPPAAPRIELRFGGGRFAAVPTLDRVGVDTIERRLELVWRAFKPCHGRLDALETIAVSLDGAR